MHANINWNDTFTWLTAVGLLGVGAVQAWFIVRNTTLSPRRKWLRAGLNALLWLILIGYFGRFSWQRERPATHALLLGEDVPAGFAHRLGDSLRVRDTFTAQTFKTDYDSVTLVGQAFSAQTLAQLSRSVVRWIPYRQPDQLQAIGWKGVVRRGELQHVTGRIRASKKQLLRIRYGTQTLDSALLRAGDNAFVLHVPAFLQGRTQLELVLGNTLLDTVRFFTRPTKPLTVQFLLNSPDFESKTLAEWLGKQGHTVQLLTTLSKNVSSNVQINKRGKQANRLPDLLITEPANAAKAAVRRAVADGRSVLFMNLTNAEADCRIINQALGSRWQVRKTTDEAVVSLGNGVNALPYRFTDALNQFAVAGYPVAVQRTAPRRFTRAGSAGRVGLSLLSETFPAALSGDTLRYNRIWTAVLAQLTVTDQTNVQIEAPVYRGLRGTIELNNNPGRLTFLRTGADTIPLSYSPLNDRSSEGLLLPRQPGWQSLSDSLAFHVGDANVGNSVANWQRLGHFMRAHARHQTPTSRTTRLVAAAVPGWVWLVLLVACFTALWVEPKVP